MKTKIKQPGYTFNHKSKNNILLFFFVFLIISAALIFLFTATSEQIPADSNLKIAFTADSGYGSEFKSVLSLIRSENASAVLHQGDFDYNDDPAGFFNQINSSLGPDFPYFVIIGNHDISYWPATSNPSYAKLNYDRMSRIGIIPDDPDLDDEMYSFTFRGLKVVYTGQEGIESGDNTYAPYIEKQLKEDTHIWRVAGWHKDQHAMQTGNKTDEAGWNVYETARRYGAIVVTAHEHSYERTKTMVNFTDQTVDPSFTDPDDVHVGTNHSFVIVSGLGGKSIRDQQRCLPYIYPYGCKGEWAKIYTKNQNATYGVLFIIFSYNGDPNRAHGYFKTINGQIIDEFNITKDA